MYAVMGDSLEVTNYLAVSGADLTIVDNVRWTHTLHTHSAIFVFVLVWAESYGSDNE